MPNWKKVKINFPTQKLGEHIEPIKRTVGENDNGDIFTVYGVSNVAGITITGKQASKDISNYIIIEKNCFAFNPYRINVGSIGLNDKDLRSCVSPAYVVFKTKETLDTSFLYHYLKSDIGNHLINWYGNRGGVRNALRYDDLCEIDIPVYDIAQQKELLKKMDLCKSSFDIVSKESEIQKEGLSRLRQTILQEAIEGKLTADWRKKNPVRKGNPDTDAAALLDKIRAEKQKLITEGKIKKEKPLTPIKPEEIPFDLPEGWVWCRLGEIGEGFQYGSSTKSFKDGKIPVLRMGNIQSASINWTDLVYTNNNEEIKKYCLKEGDLLFNRTNSRELVGKTGLFDSSRSAIFAGYLVRFSMLSNTSSIFANLVMNSKLHRKWCETNKTDALGQSNINATKLRDFYFPLPPLAEQAAIVERVDRLLAMVDELEKQVTEHKVQAEELMQAVLREAFEGK